MQSYSPPCFDYAPSRKVVASALDGFLPPARVTTADNAAAHRYLANTGGGFVGRWDHTKAPYLVGIMDALDSLEFLTVAVPGPAQCGKTGVAECWLQKCVETDPADLIWYSNTDAGIQDYVKQTINPMVQSHPRMLGRLGRERVDNSLSFKRFAGMTARFLSFTPNNLVQKFAPRIVADEYDTYASDDPKPVLDARRQTFMQESMLYAMSHPDKAEGSTLAGWNAGIMKLYAQSDRRTWWWPCAHCGLYCSPNPGTAFHSPLVFDEDAPLELVPETAHLLCPHNQCQIADADRRGMNAGGRWVGLGQTIDYETGEVLGQLTRRDTAGFWIVATMSPFLMGGIGALAALLVDADRMAEADPAKEGDRREVYAKRLGIPADPKRQAGALEANVLAERADAGLRPGVVPEGVRFITAAIDVQRNRFEILFRGWGVDRESWVIQHRIMREFKGQPVEPANDPRAWDHLLTTTLEAEFPLGDASGRVMRVRAVGVDSSDGSVTDEAYAAWSRMRKARKAHYLGLISQRRCYDLLCLKGGSVLRGPRLTVTLGDSGRNKLGKHRSDIPLGIFNPNLFKDVLAKQLVCAAPGPGYVHVPAAFRNDNPPHPWFEQLVAERRKKNGGWEPVKDHARNEVLDLMVMAAVMAHLHAPSAFNWDKPPPWARPWDQNTLVTPPSAPVIVEALREVLRAAEPATPPQARPQPAPAPLKSVPAGRPSQPATPAPWIGTSASAQVAKPW